MDRLKLQLYFIVSSLILNSYCIKLISPPQDAFTYLDPSRPEWQSRENTPQSVKQGSQNSLKCLLSCLADPSCEMYCVCWTAGEQYGQCVNFGFTKKTNSQAKFMTYVFMIYECFINGKYIGISENAVKDMALKSVAVRKSVLQSTQLTRSGLFGKEALTADRAVDGNLARTGCGGTSRESLPWIAVDLNDNYLVLAVKITNVDGSDKAFKKEELHDVDIRVGYQFFASQENTYFENTSLSCYLYTGVGGDSIFQPCIKPIIGQYVSLQIVRNCTDNPNCLPATQLNQLVICEIDVYAFLL